MTSAIKAQGVQLKRGDGVTPTEAFTLIAEITQFTGPQQTAKQVDVTSLDSVARAYISGLRDGGQVSFDLNYVPGNTGQQGLLSDLEAGKPSNYKLLLTDGVSPTTITFSAIVIAHQIKGQVDDRIMGSATLKLTGAATFTYAS